MNNSAKISLTIYLEGSALHRSVNKEFIPYVITKRDMEPLKKFEGTEGFEIVKKGVIKHIPLESSEIVEHLSICYSAYEYFISGISGPQNQGGKIWWKHLSTKERLEYHLNKICQSLQGKSFVYSILED